MHMYIYIYICACPIKRGVTYLGAKKTRKFLGRSGQFWIYKNSLLKKYVGTDKLEI